MPAIDTVTGGGRKPRKARPTPRAKAKPAPKYKVTVPDQHDTTRTRPVAKAVVTPDQADRQRGVATKAHDRQVTARVVRQQREKAVAKAGRGSGTRAVKAF